MYCNYENGKTIFSIEETTSEFIKKFHTRIISQDKLKESKKKLKLMIFKGLH